MKTNSIDCPACEGEGVIVEESEYFGRYRQTEYVCEDCNGEGSLDDIPEVLIARIQELGNKIKRYNKIKKYINEAGLVENE